MLIAAPHCYLTETAGDGEHCHGWSHESSPRAPRAPEDNFTDLTDSSPADVGRWKCGQGEKPQLSGRILRLASLAANCGLARDASARRSNHRRPPKASSGVSQSKKDRI